MLTRGADLLSRSEIWSLIHPSSIPESELEILAQGAARGIPDKFIIRPELLHKLCTSSLDDRYLSQVPIRKSQVYAAQPYVDLNELTNNETVEEEILRLIRGGAHDRYSRISPNTQVFRTPNTKKIISPEQFAKWETKFKFNSIESSLNHLKFHLPRDRDGTTVLDGKSYEENLRLIEDFVHAVKTFLEMKKLTEKERTLYNMALTCTGQLTNSNFSDFINRYQQSTLYNTGAEFKEYELCSFIIITNRNMELKFETGDTTEDKGRLQIFLRRPLRLPPRQAKVIKLNFTVQTDMMTDLKVEMPNTVNAHTEVMEAGRDSDYILLGLYNSSDISQSVEPSQPLASLLFVGNPVCDCNVKQRCYILQEMFEPDRQPVTPPHIFLNCITSTVLDLGMRPYINEAVKINGVINTMLPVMKATETVDRQLDKESYNLLLMLSQLMTDQQCFSRELIKQRQELCSHLTSLRDRVRRGEGIRNFILRDNILFKVTTEGAYQSQQLCIDTETLRWIIMGTHQRGFHFHWTVTYAHLRKYFYSVNMKKICREVGEACLPCLFSSRSYQEKFISNYTEDHPPMIFSLLHLDIVESLPVDKQRNKFLCIIVDHTTSYILGVPLKTKTSAELAAKLDTLFSYFLPPKEIVCDYASIFKSDFLVLCKKWGIKLVHSTPHHPQSNKAEVLLKLFRNYFAKYLVSMGGARARANWSKFLGMSVAIFNSSIIYPARGNSASPSQLFFGPNRFTSPRLLTMISDPELEDFRRDQSFDKLEEIRAKTRAQYRDHVTGRYREGQVVARVLSKKELPIEDQGVSLPSRGKIKGLYRILRKTKSGLRVRNLRNKGLQTLQYGQIRPIRMTSSDIHGLILNEDLVSSFHRGIFRGRTGSSLFQHIQDSRRFAQEQVEDAIRDDEDAIAEEDSRVQRRVLEEAGVNPDTVGLAASSDDEDDVGADSDVSVGDELPVDQSEEGGEPTVGIMPGDTEARETDVYTPQDDTPDTPSPPPPPHDNIGERRGASSKHNLRPRRPIRGKVFATQLSEKRRVRFKLETRIKNFRRKHPVRELGPEYTGYLKMCQDDQYDRRLSKGLSLFPVLTTLSRSEYLYLMKVRIGFNYSQQSVQQRKVKTKRSNENK